TGDHRRLDGLADAHVIGNEQPQLLLPQGHDQRHELVRPRRKREAAERTEWSGAAAKAEPYGIAKEERSREVSRCRWLGRRIAGRLDSIVALNPEEDSRHILIGAVYRPQADDVRFPRREHHPGAAACL